MSSAPQTSAEQPSILQRRHNDDCLPCRLVSGFGVIGIGAYIFSEARKRPAGPGRLAIFGVAGGALAVGASRLLGTYPFNV